MVTSRVLLAALCLVSGLRGARSPNPDTVRIEDSSDNNDDQKKLALPPTSESSKRSAIPGTQVSPPVNLWIPRTIAADHERSPILAVFMTSSLKGVKYFEQVGPLLLERNEFQRTGPYFVDQTHQRTIILKKLVMDDLPNVSREKESLREVPALNREAEASSFSGISSRTHNGSKNTLHDSNDDNRNGDERPSVEVLSNSDGDGSDYPERIGNDRPISLEPLPLTGQGGRVPLSGFQEFLYSLPPNYQDSKVLLNGRPDSFNPPSSNGQRGRWPSGNPPSSNDQNGRQPSYGRPGSQPMSSGQNRRWPSGERVPSDNRPSLVDPSSSRNQGGRPSNGRPSSFGGQGARLPSGDRRSSIDTSSSTDQDERGSSNNRPLSSRPPVDPLADSTVTRFPSVHEDDVPSSNRRTTLQDSMRLSGIINNFAFKLVESLNLEENFVISPLSIFVALSMCYLGSDGVTKAELEKTLGLDASVLRGELFHQGMYDMLRQVLPRSEAYNLQIANAMFLGRNFTVNTDFEKEIRKLYEVELKNLDFGDPQRSMAEINNWVRRATRNMIPSLTDSPLSAMTRLLMVNAVYFKGLWKTQFQENQSFEGRFTSSDGITRMVPFMAMYEEAFPFYKSEQLSHTFLKLPYHGDQMSMIFALPQRPQDMPMPSINDHILRGLRDSLVNTTVESIHIPKFRLEYGESLKTPLAGLGMSSLFDPDRKNLSRMRKDNDVHVSDVLHKAVIEVNERGTTAAATTGVDYVPLKYGNTEFWAYRPFAFYVIHEPTGLVLFYGKVYRLEGETVADSRRQTPSTIGSPLPARSPSTEALKISRVPAHGAVTYEITNKR